METRFGQEPSTSTKSHPYEAWEGTKLWSALEAAIAELVENQDLREMTAREYIVGFLAKRLSESGLS
jgi:hypothetical protein